MTSMTHQDPPAKDAMEQYRRYLTVLAQIQVDPHLQRKLDVSGVVQETFLEAHQNWSQFQGKTQPELSAWLRQIMAHNLADALRALRREKRDIARERPMKGALDESSTRLAGWLAADQSSPSQGMQREERAIAIATALAQLPEAQRDALVLQHWHGWSLRDIAQHLGRTPVAVAGLLKRGLKELRTLLREQPQA
jgi:RNA polymerase sigma-70 factor (ECF subfamily)